MTARIYRAYKHSDKRGELRRLAATKNNPLNSTGKPERTTAKTSRIMKSRVVKARDIFIADFQLPISDWRFFKLAIGIRKLAITRR